MVSSFLSVTGLLPVDFIKSRMAVFFSFPPAMDSTFSMLKGNPNSSSVFFSV